MSLVLETVMLVCFGCSWPISVCKSYRTRSAKGTSLLFILLILAGYIAGIAAKLITHSISYVLIVYAFNLMAVIANLVVYVRNLNLDRQSSAACPPTDEELPHDAQTEAYLTMNQQTTPHCIVLFGSDTFRALNERDIASLADDEYAVCNRSFEHMDINASIQALKNVVIPLSPVKIVLNLGEIESMDPKADIDRLIDSYRWLLYTLHSLTKARLYITPVLMNSPKAAEINIRLSMLAQETGITYINAAENNLLSMLHTFCRRQTITFSEAMSR